MARSHFQPLKNALSQALKGVASAGPALALEPVWAEAVGPGLAEHSRPVRLGGGTLMVEVAGEFAVDLEREAATLCERLNGRLGRGVVSRLEVIAVRGRRA